MPITVSGTQITFNDLTTQSTAATGAPTTYGAVGTYVIALYGLLQNTILAPGTTVAGSTLFKATDYGSSSDIGTAINAPFSFSSPYIYAYGNFGQTSLSLTGTWRSMVTIRNMSSAAGTFYILGLFVRVS